MTKNNSLLSFFSHPRQDLPASLSTKHQPLQQSQSSGKFNLMVNQKTQKSATESS